MNTAQWRTTATMLLAVLGFAFGGAACSTLTPGATPLGTPIESVRQGIVAPTGEYDLPDGGKRLEYAQGSFGRQTWMLDFDRGGKLVANNQVLTEANFATITPGMSARDVRMRLGRPAHVINVPRQHLQVWNYRFFGGDCVWFQVSIADAGQVTESNMGTDLACDAKDPRE